MFNIIQSIIKPSYVVKVLGIETQSLKRRDCLLTGVFLKKVGDYMNVHDVIEVYKESLFEIIITF